MCLSTVWGRAIRPEVLQSSGVSAESLGLGTVYIGALRDEETALGERLHFPEQSFVVAGLLVEWTAEGVQTLVRPRLPQNAVDGATSIDYMDGRENITDMLKGRGFPLK